MENKISPVCSITNSKDLLMLSLSKFYTKTVVNKIINVVNGQSHISLRLIDWFVTNYSKKYNTVITKEKNNNVIHFNVYLSYRSQLKAYSKQLFDPFRRRDRITFYYDKENCIETTIGQLNFFRWIIQNEILEHITANMKTIETDMVKIQKDNQSKKNNDENIKVKVLQTDTGLVVQKRKRRIQLSKSSVKNMNLTSGQRTLAFE